MNDCPDHVLQYFGDVLSAAMDTPEVVGLLWEAKHGTPQDPHGLGACLHLDKMFGGSGKPNSDIAVEFSYNSGLYLELLLSTDKYPPHLKEKADRFFPPFGREPKWEVPNEFRVSRGLLARLFRDKAVAVKLRSRGLPHTFINIGKVMPTRWLYPWQQAISARRALSTWDPSTLQPRFPGLRCEYLAAGRTRAFQVVYRWENLYCAKVPLLVMPGQEILFEMQTPFGEKYAEVFACFLRELR